MRSFMAAYDLIQANLRLYWERVTDYLTWKLLTTANQVPAVVAVSSPLRRAAMAILHAILKTNHKMVAFYWWKRDYTRGLWLTMTEMKEADLVPFLDAPVSSG